MIQNFALSLFMVTGLTCSAFAQQNFDLPSSLGYAPTQQVKGAGYSEWFSGPGAYQPNEPPTVYSPYTWQEQSNIQAAGGQAAGAQTVPAGGQLGALGGHPDEDALFHRFADQFTVAHPSVGSGASGGGGEGGAGGGAGAAVNPGVPLAQFQFQNSFLPESYGSSGYSNQFVVQPVIPITLKPGRYFEYHIVRPTLPILSPVPNPDGPVDDTEGGLGDILAIDLYFHTIQKGLVWGIGPVYNFPTSTNRQTGSGEWQIGPSFALLDSRKKSWVTGVLVEIPFSLESDAYSVFAQPVLTKL